MFLGLPDTYPDPLVTRTDPVPAPDPSSSSKNSKKNLFFYCYVNSLPVCLFTPVFRIRIRIQMRMFLGLPDPHPDPLDRGMDPRIRIRIRIQTKMSRIHNTACNINLRNSSMHYMSYTVWNPCLRVQVKPLTAGRPERSFTKRVPPPFCSRWRRSAQEASAARKRVGQKARSSTCTIKSKMFEKFTIFYYGNFYFCFSIQAVASIVVQLILLKTFQKMKKSFH
jgi:hypothetical protein